MSIYGCPPKAKVPADSMLAVTLFARLEKKANQRIDGNIQLPYDLAGFAGDGHAEIIIKGSTPIQFFWKNSAKLQEEK